MTRITNAEQVLLLLRAHLQRTRQSPKQSASARTGEPAVGALARVRQLATAEDLPDGEIERALIAGLLAEELGEAVANEPKFQTLVADVLAIIRADEPARTLMAKAIAQLSRRGA